MRRASAFFTAICPKPPETASQPWPGDSSGRGKAGEGSLGGRRVGMERHYSEWFEGHLPGQLRIYDRLRVDNELMYIVQADEQ